MEIPRFLVLLMGFVLSILLGYLLEWYRRESSEFKKYGIKNLEYGFTIRTLDKKTVHQQIVRWLEKINARDIQSVSLYQIEAYHENHWDSDEDNFIGWQKNIGIRIRSLDDRIQVLIKMTPTTGY